MLDKTREFAGLADEASLVEFAPAKINLALHVIGQRSDGYHLLESVVTFASEGDRVHIAPAAEDAFHISGRFAPNLLLDVSDTQRNLVLQARDLLRAALVQKGFAAPPVAFSLEKNLPIASGIGGGSADAAAALRGLSRFWRSPLSKDELSALAVSLGADVPMCLVSEPLVARGIGNEITLLPEMPRFAMVLGNPLVGVSTPDVFRNLPRKDNDAMQERIGDWRAHLSTLRNDLESVARGLRPEIAEVSGMIEAEGAWLTRMSGSGATCFGLFHTFDAAADAADNLRERRPDWYFVATTTVGAEP